jgi:MFS family permease
MIDTPAVAGQVPDGGRGAADIDADFGTTAPAATRGEALRTGRFWILAAAMGSMSMLITALNFHGISLLGDAGLTPTEAAVMFLPQTIGAAIAGVVFGYLSDRLSGRWLIPMVMALLAGALLIAANLTAGIVVIIYAITLGTAGGASRSVGATLLPRWFGTAHIGAISGAFTFLGVAASALGPVAFSIARDATGNYDQAALVFAAVPTLVAVVAPFVAPKRGA